MVPLPATLGDGIDMMYRMAERRKRGRRDAYLNCFGILKDANKLAKAVPIKLAKVPRIHQQRNKNYTV